MVETRTVGFNYVEVLASLPNGESGISSSQICHVPMNSSLSGMSSIHKNRLEGEVVVRGLPPTPPKNKNKKIQQIFHVWLSSFFFLGMESIQAFSLHDMEK